MFYRLFKIDGSGVDEGFEIESRNGFNCIDPSIHPELVPVLGATGDQANLTVARVEYFVPRNHPASHTNLRLVSGSDADVSTNDVVLVWSSSKLCGDAIWDAQKKEMVNPICENAPLALTKIGEAAVHQTELHYVRKWQVISTGSSAQYATYYVWDGNKWHTTGYRSLVAGAWDSLLPK